MIASPSGCEASRSRPTVLRRLLTWLGVGAFSLAVAVFVSEILILAVLRYPTLLSPLPEGVCLNLARIYSDHDRAIIQYEPAFARYDEKLFYTLRPGRFVFGNREFRTEYEVNELGVRDTAEALRAPVIIIAGDSFAMGWGVEQADTMANVLQHEAGLKVLNTAVSSYGTVREMAMLDRVDFSNVRYLVIVYSENDFEENEQFLRAGNRLEIGTREDFAAAQRWYRSLHRYVFGKYTFRMLFPISGAPPAPPDPERAAEAFINSLVVGTKQRLDRVRVLVLEPSGNPAFVRTLDRARRRSTNPAFVRDLVVIDVSAKLRPTHSFLLDEHLTRAGHAMIAHELARHIGELEASDRGEPLPAPPTR